jgi:hypothetical protein
MIFTYKYPYPFLLLIIFLFSACESEKIEAVDFDFGYEYYPLELGNSWEYYYDSIIYDPSLGIIDTSSGYIKEELTEQLAEDRYIICRFWKRDLMDNWIKKERWTVYFDDNRIVKTEENIPFIKLVFPVKEGRSWDGNALFEESLQINVAGESLRPYFNWNYEIVSTNDTYSFQEIQSENVAVIHQVNDTSFVDLRYSLEKYAPDIGLVERFTQILDCSCTNINSSDPWEEKADKGFILNQKLIKFN